MLRIKRSIQAQYNTQVNIKVLFPPKDIVYHDALGSRFYFLFLNQSEFVLFYSLY